MRLICLGRIAEAADEAALDNAAAAATASPAEVDSTAKAEPETYEFQCPDGRGFNDREAYKTHMVETILKFDKLVRELKLQFSCERLCGIIETFHIHKHAQSHVQIRTHSCTYSHILCA